MDKAEARRVLADEVGRLRGLSFAELSGRIPARPRRVLGIVRVVEEPEVESCEVTAESGTRTSSKARSSGTGGPVVTSVFSLGSTTAACLRSSR